MERDFLASTIGWDKKTAAACGFPSFWWSQYETCTDQSVSRLLVTLLEDEAQCSATPFVVKVLQEATGFSNLEIVVLDTEEIASFFTRDSGRQHGSAAVKVQDSNSRPLSRLRFFSFSCGYSGRDSSTAPVSTPRLVIDSWQSLPDGPQLCTVRTTTEEVRNAKEHWSSIEEFLHFVVGYHQQESVSRTSSTLLVIHSVTGVQRLVDDDTTSVISFLDWVRRESNEIPVPSLAILLSVHKDMEKRANLVQLRSRADRIFCVERFASGHSRHATGILKILKPTDEAEGDRKYLFKHEKHDIVFHEI